MFSDRPYELFGTRQYRFLDYLTYHKGVQTGDFQSIRVCHERSGRFSQWTPHNEGIPPYDHREILPFEIVLEWDSENRAQNYQKARSVFKFLKHSDRVFYLEDHQGRSPHIHVFYADFEDLQWIIERTGAYSSDSQVRSQGKHLVRAIGGKYKEKYYSSAFEEFADIAPVTDPGDVRWPGINLRRSD